MAFVERYVTQGAGGSGIGTEGDPWTLAEGFAQAVTGDRVNIQSDGAYSIGATTMGAAGTFTSLIVYRGYNSAIGDLEGQGRNADGTLNITNFPVITLTGLLDPLEYTLFESIYFTASLSSHMLPSSTLRDRVSLISCRLENTRNNTSAKCIQGDNAWNLINCDGECSGAVHSTIFNFNSATCIYGCRIKGVTDSPFLAIQDGSVIANLFHGNGTGLGIRVDALGISRGLVIAQNSYYNIGTFVTFPDSVPGLTPVLIDNHPTDGGKWLDNLYSGTADLAVIEINSRTRNITTPPTGIGDGANIGEITTIIGGDPTDPDQDYVDADAGNFRLVSAAPGKEAGLIEFMSCGAYQPEDVGGGGGGLLTHPGMTGGMRG